MAKVKTEIKGTSNEEYDTIVKSGDYTEIHVHIFVDKSILLKESYCKDAKIENVTDCIDSVDYFIENGTFDESIFNRKNYINDTCLYDESPESTLENDDRINFGKKSIKRSRGNDDSRHKLENDRNIFSLLCIENANKSTFSIKSEPVDKSYDVCSSSLNAPPERQLDSVQSTNTNVNILKDVKANLLCIENASESTFSIKSEPVDKSYNVCSSSLNAPPERQLDSVQSTNTNVNILKDVKTNLLCIENASERTFSIKSEPVDKSYNVCSSSLNNASERQLDSVQSTNTNVNILKDVKTNLSQNNNVSENCTDKPNGTSAYNNKNDVISDGERSSSRPCPYGDHKERPFVPIQICYKDFGQVTTEEKVSDNISSHSSNIIPYGDKKHIHSIEDTKDEKAVSFSVKYQGIYNRRNRSRATTKKHERKDNGRQRTVSTVPAHQTSQSSETAICHTHTLSTKLLKPCSPMSESQTTLGEIEPHHRLFNDNTITDGKISEPPCIPSVNTDNTTRYNDILDNSKKKSIQNCKTHDVIKCNTLQTQILHVVNNIRKVTKELYQVKHSFQDYDKCEGNQTNHMLIDSTNYEVIDMELDEQLPENEQDNLKCLCNVKQTETPTHHEYPKNNNMDTLSKNRSAICKSGVKIPTFMEEIVNSKQNSGKNGDKSSKHNRRTSDRLYVSSRSNPKFSKKHRSHSGKRCTHDMQVCPGKNITEDVCLYHNERPKTYRLSDNYNKKEECKKSEKYCYQMKNNYCTEKDDKRENKHTAYNTNSFVNKSEKYRYRKYTNALVGSGSNNFQGPFYHRKNDMKELYLEHDNSYLNRRNMRNRVSQCCTTLLDNNLSNTVSERQCCTTLLDNNLSNTVSEKQSCTSFYDNNMINSVSERKCYTTLHDNNFINNVAEQQQSKIKLRNVNVNQKQSEANVKQQQSESDVKQQISEVNVKQQQSEVNVKQQSEEHVKQQQSEKNVKQQCEVNVKQQQSEADVRLQISVVNIKQHQSEANVIKQQSKENLKQQQSKANIKQQQFEVNVKQQPESNVQQQQSKVNGKQNSEANVRQQQFDATVRQKQYEVNIKQQQPEVNIKQQQSEVNMKQQHSEVHVKQQHSEVHVKKQQSEVNIKQQSEVNVKEQPEVYVKQQPEVYVKQQSEATVKQQSEANVKQYQLQVNVKQQQSEANVKQQQFEENVKQQSEENVKQQSEANVKQQPSEANVKQQQSEVNVKQPYKANVKLLKSELNVKQQQPESNLQHQQSGVNAKQQSKSNVKQLQSDANSKKQQSQADVKQQQSEANVYQQQSDANVKQDSEANVKKQKFEANVKQQQSEVNVQQQQSEVNVQQQPSEVNVQQQQSEADVKQQQSKVNVKQQQSEVNVKQQQSEVNVKQQQSEVNLKQQQSKVPVQKQQSEANEKQQQSESTVQQQSETNTKQQQSKVNVKQQQSEANVKKEQSEANVKQQQSEENVKQQQFEANVKQQQSEVNVQQQQSETDIKQQQSEVNVKQQQSEVNLKQQQSKVIVKQQQSEANVEQQQSESKIKQQQSETNVKQQPSKMNVKQQQSEANVKQQQSEANQKQQHSEASVKQQHSEASAKQQQSEAKVKQQKPEATVLQQSETNTKQQQSEVNVNQQQSEANEKQQQSESNVKQQQSDATVKQQKFEANVKQKQSTKNVKQQHSEANVKQQQSEANVKQHKSEANVQHQSETNVKQQQPEANVKQQQSEAKVKQQQSEAKKYKSEANVKQKYEVNEKQQSEANVKQKKSELKVKQILQSKTNVKQQQSEVTIKQQQSELNVKEQQFQVKVREQKSELKMQKEHSEGILCLEESESKGTVREDQFKTKVQAQKSEVKAQSQQSEVKVQEQQSGKKHNVCTKQKEPIGKSEPKTNNQNKPSNTVSIKEQTSYISTEICKTVKSEGVREGTILSVGHTSSRSKMKDAKTDNTLSHITDYTSYRETLDSLLHVNDMKAESLSKFKIRSDFEILSVSNTCKASNDRHVKKTCSQNANLLGHQIQKATETKDSVMQFVTNTSSDVPNSTFLTNVRKQELYTSSTKITTDNNFCGKCKFLGSDGKTRKSGNYEESTKHDIACISPERKRKVVLLHSICTLTKGSKHARLTDHINSTKPNAVPSSKLNNSRKRNILEPSRKKDYSKRKSSITSRSMTSKETSHFKRKYYNAHDSYYSKYPKYSDKNCPRNSKKGHILSEDASNKQIPSIMSIVTKPLKSKNSVDTYTDKRQGHERCFHVIKEYAFDYLIKFNDKKQHIRKIKIEEFRFQLRQQLKRNFERYLYDVNDPIYSNMGPQPRFISEDVMIKCIMETIKNPHTVASRERHFHEFDEIIGHVGFNIPCYWCQVDFRYGQFFRAFPILDPIGCRDDTMYCQ